MTKTNTAKKAAVGKSAAKSTAAAVVSEAKYAKKPAAPRVIKTALDYMKEAEQNDGKVTVPAQDAGPQSRLSLDEQARLDAVRAAKRAAKGPVLAEPTNLPGDDELRPHAYLKSKGHKVCAVCFREEAHDLHKIAEEPHDDRFEWKDGQVETAEDEAKAEKLVTAAAKAAKKKPSAKLDEVVPDPPKDHVMVQAIRKAEFRYVGTAEVPGIGWAHGYQHKDGRGAILQFNVDETEVRWAVKPPADTPAPPPDDARLSGVTVAGLKLALIQTSKSALNKAAHRLAIDAKEAARKLSYAVEGATYAETIVSKIVIPASIAGLPANVVRAVEMLGGLTLQRYDLDLLRGDKWYGKRMALLKKLFNKDRVLAAETGIKNLAEAFHSAVGCADAKSAAAKAECFAARCKEIAAAVRKVKTMATKHENAVKEAALRSTAAARAVPGKILDAYDKPSKAQRKAMDGAIVADVHMLAVTADRIAVPKPDAEVDLRAEDVKLLQDPDNRLVMLLLERPNSQGAIAVYNNGSRVAAGVVPLEILVKLRPVLGTAELLEAAKQLLNPVTPGVPVTHVAARHLTAVLNCKEIIDMATKTSKKFEAPAKAATKNAKPAKKAAAKKTAVKKEPTERKSSLFRLKNDSKKVWEAFTTQKGEIVAAFVKLGAVGAKATGATRAQLIAALPKIDPKNISFYLSKWQPEILEKLAPAE